MQHVCGPRSQPGKLTEFLKRQRTVGNLELQVELLKRIWHSTGQNARNRLETADTAGRQEDPKKVGRRAKKNKKEWDT